MKDGQLIDCHGKDTHRKSLSGYSDGQRWWWLVVLETSPLPDPETKSIDYRFESIKRITYFSGHLILPNWLLSFPSFSIVFLHSSKVSKKFFSVQTIEGQSFGSAPSMYIQPISSQVHSFSLQATLGLGVGVAIGLPPPGVIIGLQTVCWVVQERRTRKKMVGYTAIVQRDLCSTRCG